MGICFYSSLCISRSRIAGLRDNSVFNLLRISQTVFQGGCIILHSKQLYIRVLVSPYPCQSMFISVFLIIAIQVDGKWCVFINWKNKHLIGCVRSSLLDVKRLRWVTFDSLHLSDLISFTSFLVNCFVVSTLSCCFLPLDLCLCSFLCLEYE